MSLLTANRSKVESAAPSIVPEAFEALAILGVLLLLLLIARFSTRSVSISVDGISDSVATHRRDVQRLLVDLDLVREHTSVNTAQDGASLVELIVHRPRSIHLSADGRITRLKTFAETPAAVMAEAGIEYDPADRIVAGRKLLGFSDTLPPEVVAEDRAAYGRAYAWNRLQKGTLQLRLQRSIPIVVEDAGLAFDLRTTAQTVGEALRDANITLFLGDRVQPSLSSPIGPGLNITIQRSTPLSLSADGSFIKTRSRAETVADLLSELKIGVAGLDTVSPPLDTPLYDNIDISVTRIHEEIEVEEDIALFETIFEPDPNLPIDTQRVLTPGAEGITRTRHRIRYVDGEIQARLFEDRWIAQEPAQRTIAYGTAIEPQSFVTDAGQEITYWRRIRMRASSYSASTAGLPPDHPWYGQTYTGEPMRDGIVAVDPSIIPLRSQVYVPGYGLGDALDTGSAIRARRIDLGYADANLELWSQWVDVYLLWPPPPDYQITWVLPNWPRLPQ